MSVAPAITDTVTHPAVLPAMPAQALAGFVHLHAAVMAHTALREAALQLVSELALQLGSERVALGLLEGERVRLVALSHQAQADGRRREFDDLRAAMEEALDQEGCLCLPEPPDAPPRVLVAHALLLGRGVESVLTVPLQVQGRPWGAVTFEWRGTRPAAIDVAGLSSQLQLLAPALALMQANERGLVQRWKDFATTAAAPWRRTALGAAAALVLAVLAWPLPERVGGKARVEGAVERALSAPAGGYLKAAHVRPGDRVTSGQLLAEMAEQDLEVDRRRLEGEVAQHEGTYMAAIARSDRSLMGVALARMAEARAQLELATHQLGRTRIEAPFDGVVIAGDLSRSVGAPVQRGDTLLTLAPAQGWRVVVEIDEADIARLRPGQRGQLALPTLPWQGVPVTLKQVTPVARAVEGANVFEVEAAPEPGADSATIAQGLRPGLQGAARFAVGERPLAWRAGEAVWRELRLAWWRLGF